jgi:outer membrane lipoprotein SlyB
MFREAHEVSPPTRSLGAVPRALWIGGALLGLATAGFAGALIMRSTQATPATEAAGPTVASMDASAAPAIAAAPAKSHHTKPAAPPLAMARVDASVPDGGQHAVACANCGVVESVSAVQQPGQATGLGAVAGGVLGGVVGHQMGGGNGKTAMTALGAIGGVLAGNEVEKRARSETLFNVQVRMEDGSTRVFQQAQSLATGTHVVVEGSKLRTARDTGGGNPPQAIRTSATSGAST